MNIKIYTLWMLLYLGVLTMTAQEKNSKVNIWEGTDCHRTVEMTLYLAPGHNNVAVVVCPGGSYFWHDMEAEGKAVGEWLQKYGISAFVLHYRTAGFWAYFTHYRYIFRGNRYPDALNDLHQAMRYIKEHSQRYGINPDSLGAMGDRKSVV